MKQLKSNFPDPFAGLSPGYAYLPQDIYGPSPDLSIWEDIVRAQTAGKGPIEGGPMPGGGFAGFAIQCLRDLGCRTHTVYGSNPAGGAPIIPLFTPGTSEANVIPELMGHG